MEVSRQLHTQAALPPGKDPYPRYPLDRRSGGPQSRSGRRGKKKFLTLPELELRPLGRPVSSQSVYRLRYPGSENYSKKMTNSSYYCLYTEAKNLLGRGTLWVSRRITPVRNHYNKDTLILPVLLL
jgi:hypothetical protein